MSVDMCWFIASLQEPVIMASFMGIPPLRGDSSNDAWWTSPYTWLLVFAKPVINSCCSVGWVTVGWVESLWIVSTLSFRCHLSNLVKTQSISLKNGWSFDGEPSHINGNFILVLSRCLLDSEVPTNVFSAGDITRTPWGPSGNGPWIRRISALENHKIVVQHMATVALFSWWFIPGWWFGTFLYFPIYWE